MNNKFTMSVESITRTTVPPVPSGGGVTPHPVAPLGAGAISSRAISILLFLVIGISGLILLNGCTNVKPWERSALADYTMRPDRDPLRDGNNEHIWFSREAASGGRGVGGGGCGCN